MYAVAVAASGIGSGGLFPHTENLNIAGVAGTIDSIESRSANRLPVGALVFGSLTDSFKRSVVYEKK